MGGAACIRTKLKLCACELGKGLGPKYPYMLFRAAATYQCDSCCSSGLLGAGVGLLTTTLQHTPTGRLWKAGTTHARDEADALRLLILTFCLQSASAQARVGSSRCRCSSIRHCQKSVLQLRRCRPLHNSKSLELLVLGLCAAHVTVKLESRSQLTERPQRKPQRGDFGHAHQEHGFLCNNRRLSAVDRLATDHMSV